MTRKIIVTALLIIGIWSTSALASTPTSHLVKLASKQERLSRSIMKAYKTKSPSTLTLLKDLESGQLKLKSNIHTPEIKNLLIYLNLCLRDLKQAVKKPYSTHNARLVADLSASLTEGNHYIAKTL
jgi:hypothetical protein